MKTIYNFILEKLTLNKQSSIYNWSIRDAKDGDIITFTENNYKHIFIFALIKKNWRYVDQICGHADYTVGKNYVNFCTGPGMLSITTLDKVSEEKFYLSTEDEKQLVFDMFKKQGYKWNDKKKEIEKI